MISRQRERGARDINFVIINLMNTLPPLSYEATLYCALNQWQVAHNILTIHPTECSDL